MVFPIAGGNESKGFEVSNSLRFNAGDSAKLTRTQTAGNRKTFTFSGWIKRSRLGDRQAIISSSIDGSNESFLWFDTADELFAKESNEATFELRTNRKFRDPATWYNFHVKYDRAQGTAANRLKIFVNGIDLDDEGGYSTDQRSTIASNSSSGWNVSSTVGGIGRRSGATASRYSQGYQDYLQQNNPGVYTNLFGGAV